MTTSEIKLKVTVDENQLPVKIEWEAPDAKEGSVCKSMMLALWDEKEKQTLKIDLWTDEMTISEMKQFFHQTLLTMADAFEKATGETLISEDLRDYCYHFAEKMDILPE